MSSLPVPDHACFRMGHHWQLDERRNAALAQHRLYGGDCTFQRGLLCCVSIGPGDAKEGETFAGVGQGIGIARHVFILDTSQVVYPGLIMDGDMMPGKTPTACETCPCTICFPPRHG